MNHVILLKRLLLLFWAVWLSVVFLSNLADTVAKDGSLAITVGKPVQGREKRKMKLFEGRK